MVEQQTQQIEEVLASEQDQGYMTFSGGQRVRVLPVSPLLIKRLQDRYADPPPPRVHVVTVEGETDQENPDDPDYQAAVARMRSERGDAVSRLVLLKGLEVTLPEDDEWIEELELLGLERPATAVAQRLAYVENVLIRTVEDLQRAVGAVLGASMVTEGGIQDAEARFRRAVPGR